MTNKIKILFIPADNIEANISRSYYFAKRLSDFAYVYFVTWKDYRTAKWLGGKSSKFNTLLCFFKSLFAKYKLYQKDAEGFTRVNCSVFIDALVGRIIGRITAKKIMRKNNTKTLKKLIENIKPDVIFYSDSYYYFPAIENHKILQVCDLQDDIDWEQFPLKLQQYEKAYLYEQYKKCQLYYIVSESAKENIAKHIGKFPFKVIYNGADFNELQRDYSTEMQKVIDKYQLQNKYIITHVGSATWVDPVFTEKLFSKIYKVDKSIVLILVGNMSKVNSPNIINVGMVPVIESYIYYNLSDMGLLLKNSIRSDFLYNSVPLKNIQYAAVKKPVISFPIQWLEKEKFNNTSIIDNENIDNWIEEIQRIRKEFKWSNIDNTQWEDYNWDKICKTMFEEILLNIKCDYYL